MPAPSYQEFLASRTCASSTRLGVPALQSHLAPSLACLPLPSVCQLHYEGGSWVPPSPPGIRPWHCPFSGPPPVALSLRGKEHIHHFTNRCHAQPAPVSPTAGAEESLHACGGLGRRAEGQQSRPSSHGNWRHAGTEGRDLPVQLCL